MNYRIATIAYSSMAIILVIGLTVSIAYAFPSTTQTSTQGTTMRSIDCGFARQCIAENPSGLMLILSLDNTSMKANSSLPFAITIVNPTSHDINISGASRWFLPDFPLAWWCPEPSIPYGFAVFGGHYTLANVSAAKNLMYPDSYPGCISTGPTNSSTFSVPPQSTLPTPDLSQYFSSRIYSIIGGSIKAGGSTVEVLSLRSDVPSTYTIAAGDEWGDIVLVSFSVTD